MVAPTRVKGWSGIWMARGEGALARHDVDAEVVDRRVEALLDDGVQAVDLVDEEDVVLLRASCEERRERALVLDDRAARRDELDAHLVREDVRERRLAEAGRPAEEDVIERLAALLRRLDEDAEVLLVLRLPDVVVEGPAGAACGRSCASSPCGDAVDRARERVVFGRARGASACRLPAGSSARDARRSELREVVADLRAAAAPRSRRRRAPRRPACR